MDNKNIVLINKDTNIKINYDILCYCYTSKLIENNDIDYIFSKKKGDEYINPFNDEYELYIEYTYEYIKEFLEKELSLELMSIIYILQFDIKTLYIYNIKFNKDELEILYKFIRNDTRIYVDEKIELTLNLNKDINYKTQLLRYKLNNIELVSDKINLMKNYFKDEECYIITCGDELNNISWKYLKSKLKHKLVFLIKQTYNDFENIGNFHFTNSNNNLEYVYNNNRIIKVHLDFNKKLDLTNIYDIVLYSDNNNAHNDYIKYLDLNYERPKTNEIIFDLAIPFAYQLGIKKINIIGWDLNETKYKYYNEKFPNYNDIDVYRSKLNKKIDLLKNIHKLNLQNLKINIFNSEILFNFFNSNYL